MCAARQQSSRSASQSHAWMKHKMEKSHLLSSEKTASTVFLYDDVRVFLINSINNCIFAK
jgi:hypothetical protein